MQKNRKIMRKIIRTLLNYFANMILPDLGCAFPALNFTCQEKGDVVELGLLPCGYLIIRSSAVYMILSGPAERISVSVRES